MSDETQRITELLHDAETGAGGMDPTTRWVVALGVFVVTLVVAWTFRKLLERRLTALAARTRTPLDDIVLGVVRRYWTPAVILLALTLGARFVPLDERLFTFSQRLFLSGFLLVVVLASSKIPELWMTQRNETSGSPHSSLVVTLARVAVLAAGTLLVLDNLGVEITPLLTALGVGSLAVGLALQPTLSNLFAGMHLSMAQPIRVGDFVELESGEQGHVLDISWRTTRLRQLGNNLLVVPNSKIAEMRLINYSLPDESQSVVFPVGVGYGSDLDHVERVTLEVAAEVQKSVPEADSEHVPFLRFAEFADSSINMNVILRTRAYTDRWPLIHAFVKTLHKRFESEGIEIPFPQRSVTVRQLDG